MSAAIASSAVDLPSAAPRRKSGRVVRKPEHFTPASSPTGSSKRKRTDESENEVDSEEEQESSEGEPDEEELREKRRKAKSKPSARKPATKKPKTNGETLNLAIRPAKSKSGTAKKPRKAAARKSALVEDADGLYGMSCPSVSKAQLTVP